MKLKRDVNKECNIKLMDYHFVRLLCERLNGSNKLEALAAATKDTLKCDEVTGILREKNAGEALLNKLGTKGKTVHDLIDYLAKINFGDGLDLFVEPEGPAIIRQPDCDGANVVVTESKHLSLICEATGIPCPEYQWYHDTRPLSGQRMRNLVIDNVCMSDCGIYCCRTSNLAGIVYSAGISVTVRRAFIHAPGGTQHTATNKVALLIGNCSYRCDKPLQAPGNDIKCLGQELSKMNYKVITCKNLRKIDMEHAVDFFVELLTTGVYGLLYFAGHGFENKGQCYLVPSDAPTDYSTDCCISAEHILQKMQEKSPALCVIMLDICRETKHSASEPAEVMPYIPKPAGNCVVAYATSFGSRAWERKEMGVFAKHLLKFLGSPQPIILMLQDVIASIGRDPDAKDIQFPEIRSNLRDFSRTLCDNIDSSGNTREVNVKSDLWQKVTELPNAMVCNRHFKELDLHVTFMFTSEYSNVLIVYIGCIKGPTSSVLKCKAFISRIMSFAVKGEAVELGRMQLWPSSFREQLHCLSVTKNTIADLQLLDQSLQVQVALTADHVEEVFTLSLGRPLVAQLKLDSTQFKPAAATRRRAMTPTECADFEPIESIAH